MRSILTTLAVALAGWTAAGQGGNGGLDDLIRHQDYTARRASSSNEDLAKNGDARSIEPGGTLVLGDLQGPGVITHIWCTIGTADMLHGRNIVLRVYYDGMEKPSIEAPIGDFFGVGHGAVANYTSEPAAVSSYGRARNCFWKMPFKKSARVTVTNESDSIRTDSFYYYLDWRKVESLPEDVPYFHARYNQDAPAKPGHYTILDTRGRGHYVGTVYSVHQVETGWFGEGDDFFYIDGEATPSLRGTGTEDYFGDAWGFRAFSTPYYGVTLWEGYFPGDRVTAYRWHIQDPIPFKESLRVEIEHKGSIYTDNVESLGGFIERPDWVSSVAYWYQTPAVGFEQPIAPAAQRVAPYRFLPAGELVVRSSEPTVLKEKYAVTYVPMKSDAWIEFDFEVPEDGRYQINGVLMNSVMAGLYQPILDGAPTGAPVNLNNEGNDPVWTRFDLHDLKAGKHTLRFEGRGAPPNLRSQAPKFYGLGLAYLALLRLEDLTGYHEALNKIVAEKQGEKQQ